MPERSTPAEEPAEPMSEERLAEVIAFSVVLVPRIRELIAEVDRLRAQIMAMKSLPLEAAAMGAAQENAACAKIADDYASYNTPSHRKAGERIAAAIRARQSRDAAPSDTNRK